MNSEYTNAQRAVLTGLRIVIGWHFLYEGSLKILNPGWTAKGYLKGAQGPFSGIFGWMGDSFISFIDPMVIAILIFVGITLILGLLPKPAALAGMIMLAFFYLAQPPFPGIMPAGPTEGNYLFVNKNLIELFALGVIYAFPADAVYSISSLFKPKS